MRRPALPATLAADAWRNRRRALAAALLVQATLLICWSVATGPSAVRLILDWIPLAAGVALIAGWRASERRLRTEAQEYFAIAGAMLVVVDTDGIIRMANRRMCEVVGHRAEALIGRTYADLLTAPGERAAVRERFAAALAGSRKGIAGIERELLCADGSRRLIEWDFALRHDSDGTVLGVLCSGEDVTERRRQEERIARDAEDLAGLRRLAQVVAASDDPRQAIVDVVAGLARADFATLVEPTAATTLVTTVATAEDILDYEIDLHGANPSGARDAYVSGDPGFHADVEGSRRVNPEMTRRTGARSVMFQPVLVEGVPAAVLTVGWRDTVPTLGSREREMVALAADETSIALQRRAALRRLEAAALTDALTGVPNRRAFDERLPQELSRARRSGKPLAVAMLDLNGFKALNDRDGHDAGDRLLRATAAAWSAELRGSDVLARLGGDEFAVLLPDCDAAEVTAVAERLRRAVPHAAGSGVGVAVWDHMESAAALLNRADRALYEDKALRSETRLLDPERLTAVAATPDAGSDELDELARAGRWLLDVPTVVISTVGDERQTFLASCGLEVDGVADGGVPMSRSICRHVVATGRPLVVDDTRESALLADHPAVVEDGIAAYAGVPLLDLGGHVVGVVCAAAPEPRSWSAADVATLRRLSERASAELGFAACSPEDVSVAGSGTRSPSR